MPSLAAMPAPAFAAVPTPPPGAAAAPTGWQDLLPHRAALVRFVRQRLQDPALAEDLVHEVFEAVVTGRAVFAGRSSLRTWLMAILKHKVVDLVRERSRWVAWSGAGDEGGDDADAAAMPELECPQPRPDEVAEQRERLARVLARIRALPATLRPAVEMRLLQDEDCDSVCRTLGISEPNLFVRLHRARRLLAA